MKLNQSKKQITLTNKSNKGFAINHHRTNRKDSDTLKEEGLKLFPMGLLNDYSLFIDTLGGSYEYPDQGIIYDGYSEPIKQYAESLPHETKCDLWEFLMFVRINKDQFKEYIEQAIREAQKSKDDVLIYLWKRLSAASGESEYFQVINGEFDKHPLEMQRWECKEEYSLQA